MKVKPNDAIKAKDRVKVAEEKRLQSIEAKRKEYKNHQNTIKAALARVDTRTNKKVIFNNEEDADCELVRVKNGDVPGKRGLFDEGDDESEVEYNFEVKEQFQGKKGKKLLELQSKYKNDKRFLLDERFVEDESGKSDNDDDPKTKLQDNGMEEDTLEEEKRAELAILEEVLGKKVRRKPEEVKKATTKGMLRYDPSKPEHANLEVKSSEISVPKKRKRKELGKRSEEGKEAEELPAVSKETFYKVKQNLKESLQENQSFSMLNMFGRNTEEEKEVQPEETPSDKVLEKSTLVTDKNPFRYDSSDNEVDVDETDEVDKPETVENSRHISLGPQKLWTEPFFFKDDDYRFQEGFDFVRRFEVEDTEFSKVRRNIKEIVKAKVKHNQRKNKPFKKKLGGRKKMIKMKKAMKR